MVSLYDIFYVIATRGEIKSFEIVKALNKRKDEYQNVFNKVLVLEKQGYIKKDRSIKIVNGEKSNKLFNIISFCINNSINYNLMLKKTMLKFIQKASKKEFFTIKDVKIHQQTFKLYADLLLKYGFLIIISKKPLKCKLLRHHFFIDLIGVFNKKLKFYEPKQHSFIKEIKKELMKYKRNLKMNYTVIRDIEKKGEVNFIYSSLNLEGNPLTLPETQKLISKDIVPKEYKLLHINEVINYKKAVDLMIRNSGRGVRLDLNLILEYHKIAMNHIKDSGMIRTQNVTIKANPEFKTCDWREIRSRLDELMIMYNDFKKKGIEDVIGFASFFHNEFQRIHPFIDGNSRISRLLMLNIIRSNNIPIMDLPLGYFDLYLDLTKRSMKRDDKSFKYLVEEIVLMSLKRINSLI